MELKNKIQSEIKVAMKNGNNARRDILRLAQNEMDMISFRENRELTEDEQQKIVRKMIEKNNETLQLLDARKETPENPARVSAAIKLVSENRILESFLPQLWSKEEITKHIYDNGLDGLVSSAASDGMAIGLAMKSLKSVAAPVDGKTVKEVIAQMRGE